MTESSIDICALDHDYCDDNLLILDSFRVDIPHLVIIFVPHGPYHVFAI